MTYIASSTSHSPIAGPSRFATVIAALRSHFAMRRSINELRALSPEILKDIGIERSEIERVVRYGRIPR